MFTSGLYDRRSHLRSRTNFVATLFQSGRRRAVEGVTENISQGGAFVRVEDWHAFSAVDQVVVTILLPADFCGQDSAPGADHQDLGLIALIFPFSWILSTKGSI